MWWFKGRRDRCFEHIERAHELVRDAPPSPEKALVLSQLARYRMLADEFDADAGREALELAEALELDEIRAHVLITTGTARRLSGDRGGRADVERGLEIALAGNWLDAAIRGYSNLSVIATEEGSVPESLRLAREAEKVAQRLGRTDALRWTHGNYPMNLLELGEWDECARVADEFLTESEALGPHYHDSNVRAARAHLRLAAGDIEAALEEQAKALASARLAKDPQVLNPTLGISAYVLAEAGQVEEGRQLFDELISNGTDVFGSFAFVITDTMRAADLLNRREEARQMLATSDQSPWFNAATALIDHEFVQAAEIFDSIGAARSAALARLRAAEALAKAGRRAEVDEQLTRALAFFRSVGASRYIREGEALLATSA